MSRLAANGIEIEYECFGDSSNSPIVLICGWGAQLLFWSEGFCQRLADRGFFVVRFDSRDVGLSTKLDHLGRPDVGAVRAGRADPPYTLDEMAADTVGLLDGLGIDAAHVLGISIGGFIAQLMAINYPDRVRSVISMASAVDGPEVLYVPRDDALQPSPTPVSDDPVDIRLAEIEDMSSPAYFDRERVRTEIERARERSTSPDGVERQAAAVHASQGRFESLGTVTVPVLVLHGALDPAFGVQHAERTAAAASNSTLIVYPDLAHDLPPQMWDRIVDDIAKHAQGVDRESSALA